MKPSLEELYKQLMKDSSLYYENQDQEYVSPDRFKSILVPDYSDYSTSTVTGNIC